MQRLAVAGKLEALGVARIGPVVDHLGLPLAVDRGADRGAAAPAQQRQSLQGNIDAAEQHRDIIARFGRFPYRNAALGRASSADELAFLHDGPRFGQ